LDDSSAQVFPYNMFTYWSIVEWIVNLREIKKIFVLLLFVQTSAVCASGSTYEQASLKATTKISFHQQIQLANMTTYINLHKYCNYYLLLMLC
jgi:hypothetical protein